APTAFLTKGTTTLSKALISEGCAAESRLTFSVSSTSTLRTQSKRRGVSVCTLAALTLYDRAPANSTFNSRCELNGLYSDSWNAPSGKHALKPASPSASLIETSGDVKPEGSATFLQIRTT